MTRFYDAIERLLLRDFTANKSTEKVYDVIGDEIVERVKPAAFKPNEQLGWITARGGVQLMVNGGPINFVTGDRDIYITLSTGSNVALDEEQVFELTEVLVNASRRLGSDKYADAARVQKISDRLAEETRRHNESNRINQRIIDGRRNRVRELEKQIEELQTENEAFRKTLDLKSEKINQLEKEVEDFQTFGKAGLMLRQSQKETECAKRKIEYFIALTGNLQQEIDELQRLLRKSTGDEKRINQLLIVNDELRKDIDRLKLQVKLQIK